MKRQNVKKYIQALVILSLLYLFYILGFPLYSIILIGLVFLLLIFLKGKLYRKIERVIEKQFPSFSKLNPVIRKIIIVAIFILIYFLLKQIVFIILKSFGFDLKRIMYDAINESMTNKS